MTSSASRQDARLRPCCSRTQRHLQASRNCLHGSRLSCSCEPTSLSNSILSGAESPYRKPFIASKICAGGCPSQYRDSFITQLHFHSRKARLCPGKLRNVKTRPCETMRNASSHPPAKTLQTAVSDRCASKIADRALPRDGGGCQWTSPFCVVPLLKSRRSSRLRGSTVDAVAVNLLANFRLAILAAGAKPLTARFCGSVRLFGHLFTESLLQQFGLCGARHSADIHGS